MASPAQLNANHLNALKSTGPRSEPGKAAVAHNARTHGLSGSFSILAHEDRAEFESLLEQYCDEFHPASPHETFLVEEMAQSRWTLARARRLEAHLLDQIAGEPAAANPDARIAAQLMTASRNPFATVQRYISAADRAYHRAHRDLTQARSAELRNKANEAQIWLKKQIEEPLFEEALAVTVPECAPDPVILSPSPARPDPHARV